MPRVQERRMGKENKSMWRGGLSPGWRAARAKTQQDAALELIGARYVSIVSGSMRGFARDCVIDC